MSGDIAASGNIAAASHSPLASRIALKIIKEGGNAVDAAVAATLVLGVVEPGWNGIGGGGFAIIYSEDSGIRVLDYRETAPSSATPEGYVDWREAAMGYKAVAVPGTLRGLWMLHSEFGELEWRRLIEEAELYARSTEVSPLWSRCMAANMDNALEKLRLSEESVKTFLKDGKPYPASSTLIQKRLLETLKTIKDDVDQFYDGWLAEEIGRVFEERGGYLSARDLSQYKPLWREPVKHVLELAGKVFEFVGMPPPGSAALIIEALEILSRLDGDAYPLLAYTLFHVMRERASRIFDPSYGEIDAERFLSESHVEEAVERVKGGETLTRVGKDGGGTSQVSVADGRGMYVSLTETIECFMGSGITVQGVLMNDEMHDFDPGTDHPNRIQPGKRPASSMSPMIILRDGVPEIIIGASGGMRIISAMTQVLYNLLMKESDPVSSVLHGRIHVRGGHVICEDSIKDTAADALRRAGLSLREMREVSMYPQTDIYFGAVQMLVRREGGRFTAVSDPRKQPGAAAQTL